jgi:hypothetical protein
MTSDSDSPFGPVIYAYTRAEALADDALVDLTDLAREAGFRIPLAVTEAVYRSYLDPSPELANEGQSFQGRARDLLQILRFAAAVYPDRDTVFFKVLFVLSPGYPPEAVDLKAICHPGDDGEPVLTVLLLNED